MKPGPNSDVNFEEVVRCERNGQILIGIDRTFARRFYTDLGLRVVEEHTGESPYLEKALVLGAFVGGPVALLASATLTVFVMGWWSALMIPIGILVWIGWYSTSSRGGVRLTGTSVFLVAVAISFWLSPPTVRELWALGLIYVFALWLGRFVYAGSTFFLRNFILRNRRAFEWLREHLILHEVG